MSAAFPLSVLTTPDADPFSPACQGCCGSSCDAELSVLHMRVGHLLAQMSLRTSSAAHFAKLCPSGCFSAPPPVVVANRPAEPGRRQSWTAPHDTSNTRSTLEDALGPPLVAVANQTSIAWKEAAWDCAIRHPCIIFPPHRHTTANDKSGQGRLLL